MVNAGYTEETWAALGHKFRADVIAHSRLSHMISLHEGEAVDSHMKRKRAKGKK